ncbi:MAG: hydroxymethylbilane synthase [Acidimicrobiales bacterium]
MNLRIATRSSPLARWQAERIGSLLCSIDDAIEPEYVLVETVADRRLDVPIWTMGGKGVFVKEVQAAVLSGRADIAVHAAKDLPSVTLDALALTAIPQRGDPRDAMVGGRLDDLHPGARVATGSVRRRAQLANLRPDLTFAGLRGNMHTRLEKAAAYAAIVVAAVALERLGLGDRIAERLPAWLIVPQVGQGALAVECRAGAGDAALRDLVVAIEHRPSRLAVASERAFLAELGGDCDLPAGAHATFTTDGDIVLDAVLASLDGHIVLRHRATGVEPEELGRTSARHLLDHAGGAALLAG